MKTMTLTITHIPHAAGPQFLTDLVERAASVDAPLDMAAVNRAAEAWVIVSTMATHLGSMDDKGPTIELASLVAMFAAKAGMTPAEG